MAYFVSVDAMPGKAAVCFVLGLYFKLMNADIVKLQRVLPGLPVLWPGRGPQLTIRCFIPVHLSSIGSRYLSLVVYHDAKGRLWSSPVKDPLNGEDSL